MTDAQTKQRYSRLAPFSVDERARLSLTAANFFSLTAYKENCSILGRIPEPKIQPFDHMAFMEFLEKTGILPEARRYMYRISELLRQLANANILVPVGPGHSMGGRYYFMKELTTRQRAGLLWLAPALGFDFLHHKLSPAALQITGRSSNGDVHAGSGFAIAPDWILTCAHVLKDMSVDSTQSFGGTKYQIEKTIWDSTTDVGLLKMSQGLPQVPGITLRDPLIGEPVATIGYPRVPLSMAPTLLMHKGEITASELKTYTGQSLFLYSAIARPGNSGGPVIAQDGAIVGIVSDELCDQDSLAGAPFYAGVRASDICEAVSRMEPGLVLPMEDYN